MTTSVAKNVSLLCKNGPFRINKILFFFFLIALVYLDEDARGQKGFLCFYAQFKQFAVGGHFIVFYVLLCL